MRIWCKRLTESKHGLLLLQIIDLVCLTKPLAFYRPSIKKAKNVQPLWTLGMREIQRSQALDIPYNMNIWQRNINTDSHTTLLNFSVVANIHLET